jgi:hypothetical protein
MTAAQVADGHPAMARCNTIAAARAASPGLTMRQCGSAFCSDPEHQMPFFIISKPRRGLLRRGESPLSDAGASCR